jgi:hypothetical protein
MLFMFMSGYYRLRHVRTGYLRLGRLGQVRIG